MLVSSNFVEQWKEHIKLLQRYFCIIVFQSDCLGMNFAALLKIQYPSRIFLKLSIFKYIT